LSVTAASASAATTAPVAATPPATAAGPTTPPSTTTESSARRLGTRLIDVHRTAVQIRAVELLNRSFRFVLVGHFDERETPGLACIAIRHDVHALYVPELRESRVQLVLGGLETEIPDKDVHLGVAPLRFKLSLSDCAGRQGKDTRQFTT
jgi:hypothetical protein